ncbi:MAG: HAD family phosphatase [Acidobacteria bacterium]|nr:HAD family phosphatase [Acidobacteriota bacterium]
MFVFFDNDGVLVDTEHLYMEASRAVLAERGIDLPQADYVELFMRQNRGLLHFADERGWSAGELMTTRARRNALYAAMLAREPLVLDGVVETLDALHGRARMAIVTSSRRDHFDIIHGRTGLLRYFDFALTDGDYPISKPDPAPYLTAVARAGVDPSLCLVVEDSERGLAAAVAAGLRAVIVPSRLTRGSRFDGAWRVLDDVRDVARVVETMQRGHG